MHDKEITYASQIDVESYNELRKAVHWITVKENRAAITSERH